MRPPLDPMMGNIPIIARVAVQFTYQLKRSGDYPNHSPAELARQALVNLPASYDGMFRFALHSLSVYLNLGYPSQVWLSEVLSACHFGSNFRRCFFFAYKEERRPYPRVTNRGVQSSSKRRADSRRLGFGDE